MLSLLNNALPINEQKYHHLNFLDHRKEVIRVINYDFTFKYDIPSHLKGIIQGSSQENYAV